MNLEFKLTKSCNKPAHKIANYAKIMPSTKQLSAGLSLLLIWRHYVKQGQATLVNQLGPLAGSSNTAPWADSLAKMIDCAQTH